MGENTFLRHGGVVPTHNGLREDCPWCRELRIRAEIRELIGAADALLRATANVCYDGVEMWSTWAALDERVQAAKDALFEKPKVEGSDG